MQFQWIFWYDWLLCPIYFYLLVKIGFSFAKKKYNGVILTNFKYGLSAKLVGGICFAFYHQYIFKGGDTYVYFDTGTKISEFLFTDFNRFLSLTFLPVGSIQHLFPPVVDGVVLTDPNFFAPRLTALLSIITFRTYIPTVLLFSTISFMGIWYAYTALCKIYPLLVKQMGYVFLFIPSVVLWGSGLGKDSLTFGGTCLVFGALLRLLLISKPKIILNIFYLFIGFMTVKIIKSYIIYSFILTFIGGIFFQKLAFIKSKIVKLILLPLIALVVGIASIVAFSYIASDPNFGADIVADNVIQRYKNTGEVSGASSAYDLGINLYDISGITSILPVFPKSIFITLFRPFVWEVGNPAMLLSALESLTLLCISIYILVKRKIFGIIPVFIKHPLTLSCLLYTLIFAGLVGISSGNFGSLVRYKIPCIPFYCFMLLLFVKGDGSSKTIKKIVVKN